HRQGWRDRLGQPAAGAFRAAQGLAASRSHQIHGRPGGHRQLKLRTEPTGEVLDILPGDAARAAAPPKRPGERLFPQCLILDGKGVVASIRPHDVEVASWLQLWKPIHKPKRSDSESFSSTASPGLIAVERSLSTISRAIKCRRFDVA